MRENVEKTKNNVNLTLLSPLSSVEERDRRKVEVSGSVLVCSAVLRKLAKPEDSPQVKIIHREVSMFPGHPALAFL